MTTAFQVNAFQNNAFQVNGGGLSPGGQFDQGVRSHRFNINRGATLGLETVRIAPQLTISAAGSYGLGPDTSVVLVNVADFVTIFLPEAAAWQQMAFDQFPNAFDGGILVKDIGGHAAAFNISVISIGTETIDTGLTYTLSTNFAKATFIPLNDGSGWAVI